LKIEDLIIRPNESPFLTTGNIDLKLKRINFYTRDSLYQLAVEEFDLYNNDIRFKNASFSPTIKNHSKESFLVTIPVLTLQKLQLEKLLEGQLQAGEAQMERPVITIQSRGGNTATATASASEGSGFYNAIHGLSELLKVKTLNVKNGTISYESLVDSSLRAHLNG